METLQQSATNDNTEIGLSDAARAAQKLHESYPDILSAFQESSSGQCLREINCTEDLASCSRVNTSEVVPILIERSPCIFIDQYRKINTERRSNLMNSRPSIIVAGILDTKGQEIKYLADRVKAAGGEPTILELSVGSEVGWADISVGTI